MEGRFEEGGENISWNSSRNIQEGIVGPTPAGHKTSFRLTIFKMFRPNFMMAITQSSLLSWLHSLAAIHGQGNS